jgi:hypothetical protein
MWNHNTSSLQEKQLNAPRWPVLATLALPLHWPLEFPLPRALQSFHDLALSKSISTGVLLIDGGVFDELYRCYRLVGAAWLL